MHVWFSLQRGRRSMARRSKRDERIYTEAQAALRLAIERGLDACGDVDSFEVDPETGVISVDMSHPEACYVPFRVSISLLRSEA